MQKRIMIKNFSIFGSEASCLPTRASKLLASANCPAVVKIPDIEAAAFKVMLSFIYADDLSGLNGDNAMAVLYAADKYNIPDLVVPSLQIPFSELRNVFLAYAQARLFDFEEYCKDCLDYIDKNADALLKSDEFLQIDQKLLCEILERDQLQISGEISIWEAQKIAVYSPDNDINGQFNFCLRFCSDKYNITGLVKECANFPIEKLPNVFVAFEQALLLNMEAYHLCRHAQSFESSDCVSSDGLFKTMFSDSAVAKKFGCARNKASKIITGVLAPYSVQIMLSELGNHYFSIALDSFNHKTTKLFPIVIRYFVAENGIQVRLLDLQALPGETAEEVYQWILKMLQKHGLKFERIVAFCADNTAANFGSAEHRGENNVFYKLRAHKNNLIPVGCPAHVLHNAAKRGADNLSIDIESIVFKLTSHFKNSTKRTTLDYIDKWFRLERFPKSISWVGLDENERFVLLELRYLGLVLGSLRQPTCTWFHSSDEQTHCIFQCNGNRKCSNSHVIPPPSLSPGTEGGKNRGRGGGRDDCGGRGGGRGGGGNRDNRHVSAHQMSETKCMSADAKTLTQGLGSEAQEAQSALKQQKHASTH
ncbi:hypothetical protein niasHT_003333 [Heterodera trifolii]|uniref:BTB domain-containing protein n=1 Tax=Heterodera trifolii TaxID=157864 RepID=A0ABD2LXW7_9BILA